MPSNRIHSTLLLLFLLCGLVTTPGWTHPQAQGEMNDEAAMEGGGEEGGPEGMEEMDPTAGPPFEEVIKDCERIDGFVTFYLNRKTGQAYIALTPDQMNQNMMVSTTLNAGSGGGAFIAPMLWPDLPVYFQQTYRTVQLIQPNTYVTANASSPIARAVKTGTADSVLASLPLASQPAPKPKGMDDEKVAKDQDHATAADQGDDDDESAQDDGDDSDDEDDGDESEDESDEDEAPAPVAEGTILVDATALLLYTDLLNLGSMGMGMDPAGSFITDIAGFPQNSNIELTLNAMGGGGMGMFGAGGLTPDARSTIVKLIIVFSELPADDSYRPRLSDERIGYFLTMHQDFTVDDKDTRYVRYINRWKLEPQDPTAERSEPKEPIVFWIENTVPHKYREAVKQGIEAWQPAFEAAGFTNGIIAKQMPDDADWDPADIRYNVVRWFVAPGAGFAIGPSRANPFTGQIYDADIGFSADMLAFASLEYRYLVNPLAAIAQSRDQALAMGLSLPPTVLDLPALAAGDRSRLRQALTTTPPVLSPMARAKGWQYCNFASEAAEAAASGLYAAEAIRPGQIDEDEFVRQYLVSVVAHEVGHTLGLRHNYKASTYHTFAELGTDEACALGLTGSVMDYTGTNIRSSDERQPEYSQTRVGPYDIAAIRYGYTPLGGASGSTPEAELPTLEKIANQWGEPGHAYATDEDQYGWSAAMDPSSVAWDLGKDNLAYYEDQIKISHELWDRLEFTHNGTGSRYQKYRTGFGWGIRSYAIASQGVPRYIGGIYHSRSRVGDPNGQVPYTPVSADEQRAALNFLIRHYWSPDSFSFPPDLLRKLATEREPDFQGTVWTMERRDIPIHDVVLNLELAPMMFIYDPLTLRRLTDTAKLVPPGTDVMTTAELFGAVRGAIWQEAFESRSSDSYRRNLQRLHLEVASSIYLYGAGWYPQDALTLARLDLTTLRAGLTKAIATPALDGLSRAHYQESLDRIDETLNATAIKLPGF